MKQRCFWLAAAVVAVLAAGLGAAGLAAQSARVDVTGVWTFTVESAAGAGTPTITFKQEGEKLTGHYSSQLLGEAELTGTVKGQTIDFIVAADIQGTRFELRYTGTIEGKDSMNGKLSAAELGDGTFTGKRK